MKARVLLVGAAAAFAIVQLTHAAATVRLLAQSDPVFLDLQASRARYPTPMSAAQQAALLNEVAFRHPGVGLELKAGGNHCPQPGSDKPVACDILRFKGSVGRDVLFDAEGAGRVVWGDALPADEHTFVEPVFPGGGSPPPPPPPDLTARVAVLEAAISNQQSTIANQQTRLGELASRVSALESKPPPVLELPRLRVKGQTGRSLGHAHTFTADVEIVR